jgi:hypothetical protein
MNLCIHSPIQAQKQLYLYVLVNAVGLQNITGIIQNIFVSTDSFGEICPNIVGPKIK